MLMEGGVRIPGAEFMSVTALMVPSLMLYFGREPGRWKMSSLKFQSRYTLLQLTRVELQHVSRIAFGFTLCTSTEMDEVLYMTYSYM